MSAHPRAFARVILAIPSSIWPHSSSINLSQHVKERFLPPARRHFLWLTMQR